MALDWLWIDCGLVVDMCGRFLTGKPSARKFPQNFDIQVHSSTDTHHRFSTKINYIALFPQVTPPDDDEKGMRISEIFTEVM